MATMQIDIEEWVKDLLAAWTSHDVEKILSFYTDDCILENLAISKVLNGKEPLRAYIEESITVLPDFRIEAKSCFASGDHVCIQWIMSGTEGNLPGMPFPDKNYSVQGVAVIEMKEGKAKRKTEYYDSATLMRQLGILPASPEQ